MPPHGIKIFKKMVADGAGGLIEIDWGLGIWVQPEHNNGTPMEDAFKLAAELVEVWTRDNPDSFPPIVINISDGEPNDPAASRQEAERIAGFHTSDGNVLIYNCHIGTHTPEIKLPASEAVLPDANSRLLFYMSSIIPQELVPLAQMGGLTTQPGSRGLIINATPEALTKLLVFASGSMKA